MAECIAVVNAGSSSVKFGIYDTEGDETLLVSGQVEQIGVSPTLIAKDGDGKELANKHWPAEGFGHPEAMHVIIDTLRDLLPGSSIVGIGHRVVHGGTDFAEPVLITAEVVTKLGKLCPLAPLHQPHNLGPIKAISIRVPTIPQVACFDTGFHQTQERLAYSFALPREITDKGVRRYGFHGLSYEFVSGKLREVAPEFADRKIVIAHLGNGASLCALHGGKSVATTMGFTAVEGLMMGTRCGSIDPGVLIYLMDEAGMDARRLETVVYKKSGLLGVSGISSDMRTLRQSDEPNAKEATDLFVYRVVREIGSLAAALGGLDGLVFTGGIGQRDTKTRAEVVAGCGWLGAQIDEQANAEHRERIEASSSKIPVWVLPTDEEMVICRHTARLLSL